MYKYNSLLNLRVQVNDPLPHEMTEGVGVAEQHQKEDGVLLTAGKDLSVSALSAALAHALHHPLYTLKSQMMYYGPQFSYIRFARRSVTEKTFLFRGTKDPALKH